MGELGRHRGVWRTLGLSVAWLLLAAAAGLALLYAVPELQLVHRLATLAAVFIPFGVLLWGAAVLLFLAAGRGWGKLLALVAVAGLVLAVLWARPYWPAGIGEDGPTGPDAGGGGGVVGTVMTFNARCDSAWADELEESIVARQPDLVVVQGASTRLRESVDTGLAEAYPHWAFVYEMWGLPSCGTVVLSRLPLGEVPPRSFEQPVVGVDLGFGPVTLVPVDVPGPHDGLRPWREAIDGVGAAVDGAAVDGARPDVPVLVAGDFNAVREHGPLRRLLGRFGLESAAEQAGAGWVPTYPADTWYPPVLAIDHVLVGPGLEAVGVETVRIGGYSHLALVVEVRAR